MRIVHLLNWDLKSIEKILPDIEKQGFNAIQINPMQPFKEETEFYWWSSYQPLDFKIGNRFGDKEDLTTLCTKAKNLNISIYVDVIANHMANKGANYELVPHPSVASRLLNNSRFWKKQQMMTNGEDREDAVGNSIGLPGMNYKEKELIKIVLDYLNELRQCGVSGYRFDAAKHIGLPNDGVMLFDEVKKFLCRESLFGYGEFLSGNTVWQEEFARYLPVLTHYSSRLRDTRDEVTFIESHDTYLNDCWDSTRRFSSNELINYYNLLSNNFANTIYYVRPKYKPYDPMGTVPSSGNLETIDYFETYFLEDERFKEINSVSKQLKLIL